MGHTPVDKNMIFANHLNIEGLTYHNFLDEPFRVYGLVKEGATYIRLPEASAAAVSPAVYDMYRTTTGGRLRFVSDSPYVAIRASLSRVERIPNMTAMGTLGFDLYADGLYAGTFAPSMTEDAYEAIVRFPESKTRSLMIHFPLYANIDSLEIGLDERATLTAAADYRVEKPMVFYGSSITNGACASRPGMAYPAQVGRLLDADHYNLGFGGSAKGEPSMAEYIASLDMSVFVLDYDHNASDPDYLLKTHEPFYKTVREKNPDLPILMLTAPKVDRNETWQKRYEIIKKTYENAVSAGDKNVYFLDGAAPLYDIGPDYFVDGIHPSDLGFYRMAGAVADILRPILK